MLVTTGGIRSHPIGSDHAVSAGENGNLHGGDAVKLPLSVFIITRDEEARLPLCLDALVSWVDEIVIVDSGSVDRTTDIAEAYGVRLHHREWTGYGEQKRYAEQRCHHDWVLNVDADEVVTEELAREIKALFATGAPAPDAFLVPILTVYPGKKKPRLWASDYNVVRLYHKSVGSYCEDAVYDRVDIGDCQAQQLSAPIYHHTHISIAHAVEKALKFAEFRATHSSGYSRSLLKTRLLLEFPMVFLKTYFGRRHFTGGWHGYYFALCHAFMRTTRIAFILEKRARALSEKGL